MDPGKKMPAALSDSEQVVGTGLQTISDRPRIKARDERLPWEKFSFSDHRNEPSLRISSLPARGLWMDTLCLMHESERRGFLLLNGRPLSVPQLARIVGEQVEVVAALLAELEENGVFSRDPAGVIFSRRMVRDHEYREQQRELGRLGGNPRLTGKKALVNSAHKAGVKAPHKLEKNRLEENRVEKNTSVPVGTSVSSPCGETESTDGMGSGIDEDRRNVDLVGAVEAIARGMRP